MSGEVGSVGGAPSVGGGSAPSPVTPVSEAPAGGDTDAAVGAKDVGFAEHHNCSSGSMSTEDFLSLHSSGTQEPQGTEFDLKKIVEMMIALELLKEISKAE